MESDKKCIACGAIIPAGKSEVRTYEGIYCVICAEGLDFED